MKTVIAETTRFRVLESGSTYSREVKYSLESKRDGYFRGYASRQEALNDMNIIEANKPAGKPLRVHEILLDRLGEGYSVGIYTLSDTYSLMHDNSTIHSAKTLTDLCVYMDKLSKKLGYKTYLNEQRP